MITSLGQPQVDHRRTESAALTIRVSRGAAAGRTRLGAFDNALRAAGVADFNLVRLSSVIPPRSVVYEAEPGEQIRGGHGDVLYSVYADAYATISDQSAWAGITWAQHEDGAGLFAESSGWSRQLVEWELEQTMAAMIESRPAGFRPAGTVLSSITCQAEPVCAVVVASYRCVPWGEGGIG